MALSVIAAVAASGVSGSMQAQMQLYDAVRN